MKIETTVKDSSGNPLEVKVRYQGWEKDKVDGKQLDEFVEVYIRLGRLPSTNTITYQGHGSVVRGYNGGFIPSDARYQSPEKLFKQAFKDVLKDERYAHWQPKLQEEIEAYIKQQTKDGKTYSMRGELAKAVFVCVYLYYIANYPSSLNQRHKAICEKLNMKSGSFTGNLVRVSKTLPEVSKVAKRKGFNMFEDKRKLTIKGDDVYLMKNSERNIQGGYLTGYAKGLVEDWMEEFWKEKGIDYRPSLMPECQYALVDKKYLKEFDK